MKDRFQKLGIKQTIQRHWMDHTVQMMLAGMSEQEIRAELDDYLSTRKQSGGTGERGKKTYSMAIAILASWFSPEPELLPFRDNVLSIATSLKPTEWLPLHWAVISASYPFWFHVAGQTGRLLNLQNQITQRQIFTRLKEQYGDRETVARNGRYTVRSLVAWEVLKDGVKGCYEKSETTSVTDMDSAILMLEAALHTTPEGKGELSMLLNNPAFFPFRLPAMTGNFISQFSDRIDIVRYGLDDELLKLKGTAYSQA